MNTRNIYLTFTAEAYNYKKLLPDVVHYISVNDECICRSSEVSQLLSSKTIFDSPLTNLYSRLAMEDVLSEWTFIKPLKHNTGGVPTALTLKQIPIDMEQTVPIVDTQLAHIIEAQHFTANKIILNVVPFTKGDGSLVDATEFHSHIVRDALVRSYYKSFQSTWISPAFCQYLTKVYTMILGGSVSQWYRLDMKNSRLISYLFALYFLSQMVGTPVAVEILKTSNKLITLPEPHEQIQILEMAKKVTPEIMTEGLKDINTLFKIVNEGLNIPRVNVDRNLLCSKLRGVISTDIVYTSFGVSYPPMFGYLVLRALSGIPSGLSMKMKTMGLINPKDKETVANELIRSRSLIDSLQNGR